MIFYKLLVLYEIRWIFMFISIHILSFYIIVTDMEGNIRIYRLPKGRDTDNEIYISLASVSGNMIFIGPRADCIS